MHIHMLAASAEPGEAIQAFLQSGSRVLMMIAMALFLAYALFFLSTVSIASAITTWHHVRRRPHQAEHPRAMAPVTPAQELPHQEVPSRGRRAVRTGGRA